MNRKKIAYVGLLVGVAAGSNIHGRIRQHAKDVKVITQLGIEFMALAKAYVRVQKKINNGEYSADDMDRIEEQFEFEIIAAHYE